MNLQDKEYVIKKIVILFLLANLFSSYLFADIFSFSTNSLHKCSIYGKNIYLSQRECKSEFIAKNPRFDSGSIYATINLDNESIDIYSSKLFNLKSAFSLSYDPTLSNNPVFWITSFYDEYLLDYSFLNIGEVQRQNISIGYKFWHNLYDIKSYSNIKIGYLNYSKEYSVDGYNVSIRNGIVKKIFNVNVILFNESSYDIIGGYNIFINTSGVGFEI